MSDAAAKRNKPEKPAVFARVRDDGALVMADPYSAAYMRRKKINRGALVRIASVSKVDDERNWKQFKAAHQLGTLLIQNLEEFEHFQLPNGKPDSHGALKYLQALSGVECEVFTVVDNDTGECVLCRMPNSLAFDRMDQADFDAAYKGFCDHIIKRWWGGLDQASIESMASLVGMGS